MKAGIVGRAARPRPRCRDPLRTIARAGQHAQPSTLCGEIPALQMFVGTYAWFGITKR